MKRTLVLATTALLLTGMAACGDDHSVGSDSPPPARTTPATPAVDPAATDLTVFAAASLTESFTDLGEAYEEAHPGADVTFSFAGSQSLVAQIQQGAPADVIATANQPTIDQVTDELAGSALIFAQNQLSIITEPGNPLMIDGLADLADPDLQVVLAAEAVPVGRASKKVLDEAMVTVMPVSQEQDVKAVLAKVRLGEADAGIVYVTDVSSAGDAVSGMELPGVSNVYPIGVLAEADNGPAAGAFVAFVLSPPGQAILASYGFKPPTTASDTPASATASATETASP